MSASIIGNGLSVATKLIDATYKEVTAPNGAGIEESAVININGVNKVVTKRVEDSYKFVGVNKATANAKNKLAIFDVSRKLIDALGNPIDDNFISNTLINLLNDFNIVEGTEVSAARSQIVNSAQRFTATATSYVGELQVIKNNVEADISAVITNINDCIIQIASINSKLTNKKNTDLLQNRDDLILKLSEYAEIKYSVSRDSGKVTVRTNNGNILVSDNDTLSQFSYIPDSNLFRPNEASRVLTITEHTGNADSTTIFTIQTSDVIANFGGKLAGLLDIRDNLLPTTLKNINDKISQVADKINNLHNVGSGFPPPTSLTSTKSMSLADSAVFKGTLALGTTDDLGNAVKDINGNYLKPRIIDFDKLYSRNSTVSGQFTTQDIINEINRVAEGYGKASVGLGEFNTPVGEAPQWLIDQVRLVPSSDVSADGTMSFQLELNSGSNVNTSFQVTGMSVIDQANHILVQAFVPPAAINVAAGQNTKTGQNIIMKLNPLNTQNTVRLKMCVIGANGIVEEAWADFNVNNGAVPLAGAQIMNQRYEAVPADNAFGGGIDPTISYPAGGAPAAATATNAKFIGPTIVADFVDSNGLSINNGTQPGYLKISAVGGKLIIDQATSSVLPTNAVRTDAPKNFGHNYSLNDFFTADPINPASNIAVRPDILSNPGLIALGKTEHHLVEKNVMVGQTLPSAVLDIAVNPAVGDSIMIGTIIFTFVAVAAAPNDIVIGVNAIATTQNIYNALQTDQVRPIVTATPPNGAANLIITAAAAVQGANIAVVSSNPANEWKMPPATVGGIPGGTVNKLVGGAAAAIFDCNFVDVPAYGDTITINGMTWTFGAGAGQIAVGVEVDQTITNLRNALAASTDPKIAGLFVFTIDPAHPRQLIVTAKNAGFEGNKLQISSSITSFLGPVNNWEQPGAPVPHTITNLVGGFSTSSPVNVDTYALKIGSASNTNMTDLDTSLFTFRQGDNNYTQTISSFFVDFVAVLKSRYDSDKMDSDVADKVAENLLLEYNTLTTLNDDNREEFYIRFQDAVEMKRIMWEAYQIMREAENMIFDYLRY